MAEDEPLARPFLARPGSHSHAGHEAAPGAGHEAAPGAGHDPGYHGEVRPYLLTGGRTSGRGDAVAMETVVVATGLRPVRTSDAAGVERARIVQLAERPCSAAEVAAWLHLPLQVAFVL